MRVPVLIGCSCEKQPQTMFGSKNEARRRFDALVQSTKITSPQPKKSTSFDLSIFLSKPQAWCVITR